MGTGAQPSWSGSSGLLIVPRGSEGTAKPFTPIETTGGTMPSASPAIPAVVPAQEQEWASLLSIERKRLVKRRVGPKAVNKAVKGVRYGR